MGIIRQGRKTMVNRVVCTDLDHHLLLLNCSFPQECDTGFDFDKVQQIMVSEAVACPVKADYWYVHVLCFTSQPLPLILPYLFFNVGGRNTLRDWLFVNNKMVESRHQVKEFKTVAKGQT